jgi:hypothetical protein
MAERVLMVGASGEYIWYSQHVCAWKGDEMEVGEVYKGSRSGEGRDE